MGTPTPAPARHRRLFAAYLRRHRRAVGGLAAVLVVATALPLLTPQLLRRFVDQAVAARPLSTLMTTAALYLAVALGSQAVNVASAYGASRLAWSATNQLREDLASHALGLDLAFHGGHTPGEMIERVDGDVTALANFFAQFVVRVIGAGLLLAGVMIVVTIEDWRVGAALAALVAAAAVALVRLKERAVPSATADRAANALVIGNLEERLAGAEDLRANGAGHHTVGRFLDVSRDWFRTGIRAERNIATLVAVTNTLFAVGSAGTLAVGVVLQRSGAISIGTVVLLFQYTRMVRYPLEQMVDQLKVFQQAAAGASRAAELLDLRPAVVDTGTTPLPTGPLSVAFDHVTFAYRDEGVDDDDGVAGADADVLRDVTLEVGAGRVLGLVGRTGSGKTTMARLLLRLYDTTAGGVRVGDVDVRDAPISDVRRRIGFVTQDVQLFHASLRDNLTLFGTVDVDDDRLIEVVTTLGLRRWLASLPAGLDTELGSGDTGARIPTTGVSAGEAQLLAFGRVFLRDPGVVVLDEASSRLDPGTETLIEAAIDRLLSGRTAILIAHRLGSLDRCDDIAVVEAGRVVEHGARAALAADPTSRFARLRALGASAVLA